MPAQFVAPKSALGRLATTAILVAALLVAPTVRHLGTSTPPSTARASATTGTTTVTTIDRTPRATPVGWRDGFATMYWISSSWHPTWDARGLYRLPGYSAINTDFVDLGTPAACGAAWCATANAASALANLPVSITGEDTGVPARVTYQGAAHSISAAVFAYWSGGNIASILFRDDTGRQFRIAARVGANDLAALFPTLLQGQWSPSNLNLTGGDDAAQVYAGQYSAVLHSSAAPAGTTCQGKCFSLLGPSNAAIGMLDASPEQTVLALASGASVPISQAALDYAQDQPSDAPMMRINVNGTYYAVPASDAAGAEIRADVYAPTFANGNGPTWLSAASRKSLLDQTRSAPAMKTAVSAAEYAYYFDRDPANAQAYYTTKNSYTDAELNAMTLVSVNTADPGSFIDNAQKNYKVITTGPTALQFKSSTYSLTTDATVVGVGQGFAQRNGAWIPVLVIQSTDSSIALVDLTTEQAKAVFGQAEDGLLTGRVTLSQSGQFVTPLTRGARLTFVSTASPASVLMPATAQWVASGTGSALNLPGQAASLGVARVAYGSYQQTNAGGAAIGMALPVVAAQLADGRTYLFGAASGALPSGAIAQLDAAFRPMYDRGAAIATENSAAAADTIATYQYAAVTAGVDATRMKLLTAMDAEAVRQNGVALPALNGRTKMTATEAQQFFDGDAVKKAITDGFTSTEVLADLRRIIAQDASITGNLAAPVPGDAPRVVTSLAQQPQVPLAANGTPATAQQVAMGLSAVAWILDELAAGKNPPTNPALGGTINQLRIRLAQDYPTSSDGDRTSALYVAYQLMGISNQQLWTNTDPTVLRNALDVRGLLDGSTTAVPAFGCTSGDPAGLSYQDAVGYCASSSVPRWVSYPAPSAANARTVLASLKFVPGNVDTWRAAQQFTRSAFADFSAWAKPYSALADTMAALDKAFHILSGRLMDLDPALSTKLALSTLWQGVADDYTGIKFSDLSDEQLTNMFASAPAYIVGIARAVVRDTGLWTSVYKDLVKVADEVSNEGFVQFMVSLFRNKPIPVVDTDAITQAIASPAGIEIPLLYTLNKYGLFGTFASLLATVAMFVRIGQGAPTPQDLVAIGQNLVTALSTAPHYPRAIALIPRTFAGKDATARLARMNSLLGLGNDMQTNITLLLDSSNARINATMNKISAKFGNVAAESISAEALAEVLAESGWRPISAAASMNDVARQIITDSSDGSMDLALRRISSETEDVGLAAVRSVFKGKQVGVKFATDGSMVITNPTAVAELVSKGGPYPEAQLARIVQGNKQSIAQVVDALQNLSADDMASDVLGFAGSSPDETAVGRRILAAVQDALPSPGGGVIQRISPFRWSTLARIVGLTLQAVAALTDFGAGVFQIVLAAIQLADPARTSLQTIEGALNIASGTFILVAGILEIIGALIGTVVFLTLFAIGVLIALIAFAITFIPDWEKDQDALTAWAKPYLDAGLLASPQTATTALVWWHRQNAGPLMPFPKCATNAVSTCSPTARTYSSLKSTYPGFCVGVSATQLGGGQKMAVDLPCPAQNMTVLSGMGGATNLVGRWPTGPGMCLTEITSTLVMGQQCTGLDHDPSDVPAQQWTVIPFGDGTYSYRNQGYYKLCLDSAGGLSQCDGSPGQRFRVTTP